MIASCIIYHPNVSEATAVQEVVNSFETINCLNICTSIEELSNQTLKTNPNIVIVFIDADTITLFLEINQLQHLLSKSVKFIAISDSTEKAYTTIKFGFTDYWLLPINEIEVRKTVTHLTKNINESAETICLKSYKDFHYLKTSEILYLKADNNTTDFFMKDGRKISAYKTLKSFEKQLPHNFYSIHQSYILNSDYVSRINYGKSLCALKNNTELPFSRTYRKRIDQLKLELNKTTINNIL